MKRREFVGLTVTAIAGTVLVTGPTSAASSNVQIHAVAFDAFPIFDPRPVFALAEELFPGKGEELGQAWRTWQFEYTWLRTVADRYTDFLQVTEDALVFATRNLQLALSPDKRSHLVQAYLELKAWPDVPDALKALRASGIRPTFLSNLSKRMLETGIKNSGLEGVFEHLLSTDAVQRFKPSPRAYQMAVDAFRLKPESIVFAAFAGWDAAGAKWFGFPTVWVNRLISPPEQMSVTPAAICQDLSGLVSFVTSTRR